MNQSATTGLGERPIATKKPEIFSGRRSVASTWVEVPSVEGPPTAWLYSDKHGYRPEQTVNLFISANVPKVTIRIYREGPSRTLVHEKKGLAVAFQAVPPAAYMNGCGWQSSHEWKIGEDTPSGGYLIEVLAYDREDDAAIGHHLVFVRSYGDKEKTLALVAATATWRAYNDFGGANHYRGIHPEYSQGASPILSVHRPWARGQIWLPEGAPRLSSPERPQRPMPPRYPAFEYAHANGYARNYGASGWASFERLFICWAEQNGYVVDILAQDELHDTPDILNEYPCTVFVGHCEYWSAEMRQTVHQYLDQGGNVARFAGNFLWQVRMDDSLGQQICYKYNARQLDPIADQDDKSRLTSAWEDPLVGWPGAATFGVNALRGIYAGGLGGMAPRAARGFTVFRPEHWCFEGTGLGYAEMFGDEHNIFSYEVDGLSYTFDDGLPVPIGDDGAPENLQILAMGWATLAETGLPAHRYAQAIGNADAVFRASLLAGRTDPDAVAKHSRGSGMMVSFRLGAGEVFTAGTCEWVVGLQANDFYTASITKNVLDRFLAQH